MKRSLLFGSLIPLFMFSLLTQSTFSQTQTSTASARDPQATVLLQRSLAALVGSGTVKDVILTGTGNYIVGSDSETGTTTLKATAVGQSRFDMSTSAGQRSEVRDLSVAPPTGTWLARDGSTHAMAEHNLMTEPAWFFPAFILADVLSNSNYSISAIDQQSTSGSSVYHITVFLQIATPGDTSNWIQRLTRMELYLDPTSFLPTAMVVNVHPDNNASLDLPEEFTFSGYQTAQGAQVPFHIQRYRNHTLLIDIQVSTVTFNSALTTSTFTLP
jgi:hypothetical protein